MVGFHVSDDLFSFLMRKKAKNRENYDLTLTMPEVSASRAEVTVIEQCLQIWIHELLVEK